MPSVIILQINDYLIGPHLELLRYICDPYTRSKPHITVRYFNKVDRARNRYLDTRIEYIDLIEPQSFGLEKSNTGDKYVISLRCESVQLANLEHKPDFPSSDLHITLYEGSSLGFAKSLLLLLKQFRWRFRVFLPKGTKLVELPINKHNSRRNVVNRSYNKDILKLFFNIAKKQLASSFLVELNEKQKLEYIEKICQHLEKAILHRPIISNIYSSKSASLYSSSATEASSEHSYAASIFVTPPELAEDMAQLAISLLDKSTISIDFGDPANGVGAFYQALIQIIPKERISSAIGIDINPKMVFLAKLKWGDRGLKVLRGDYLHMGILPHRNLILANPPYLRHQKIPPKYKEKLRNRIVSLNGNWISARSGQYVYFLLLSHQWMSPNAIAVWLIPSEFMQTEYGSAIRQYLTSKVELLRIHIFGHDDPQFETALVLPSVVAFRNKLPSTQHKVIFSIGGTIFNFKKSIIHINSELKDDSTWKAILLGKRNIARTKYKIEDLFIVRRGIATGANTFFILEREDAIQKGIPEIALRPILPKARVLNSYIIEVEPDGYPKLSPQLSVIDTDLPEEEIEKKYPSFMEYLNSGKEKELLSRNLIRNRSPWYKQEQRQPAPFLCTYMGRGSSNNPPIRFIWNKSTAIATNTFIMLYPTNALKKFINNKLSIYKKIFGFLEEIASKYLLENYRIHAGGLYKIEPGELRKVSLPYIPYWLKGLLNNELDL